MEILKYIIWPFKWLWGVILRWCKTLTNGVALFCMLAAQFLLIAGALRLFPENATAMAIAAWGITIVSTVIIGINPITYFITRFNRSAIEKEFKDKAEVERMIKKFTDKENELENQILDLQGEVAKSKGELDTLKQTQCLVTSYKSSRELQILTVSKSGHIVKEEALYPLKAVKDDEGVPVFEGIFPKRKFFWGRISRDVIPEDDWKVFFTDNTIYEYSVGIKLDDIRYVIDLDSNVIYFKNVKLSRLRHLGGDYGPIIKIKNITKDITNHVWIVKRDEKTNYSIINDPQHQDFINRYKKIQRHIAGSSIEKAIDERCEFFTDGLQRMLIARYGDHICFVKDEEDDGRFNWKTLSEGLRTSGDVRTFMNDLYLAFDAMELCADNNPHLDKSLLPEQASA